MNKIDLTGQVFGRLKVLEEVPNKKRITWKCICECGNYTEVASCHLRSGKIKSCGCLRSERISTLKTIHGQAKRGARSRLYVIWVGIKERCENPNYDSFENYGGRGIMLCDEWQTFEQFMLWAYENGYDANLTIDRVDVNGNYCPQNCRWVSRKTQSNNTRRNINITYLGETHTLAEWSEILGVSYMLLYKRIVVRNWDIERAMATSSC